MLFDGDSFFVVVFFLGWGAMFLVFWDKGLTLWPPKPIDGESSMGEILWLSHREPGGEGRGVSSKTTVFWTFLLCISIRNRGNS